MRPNRYFAALGATIAALGIASSAQAGQAATKPTDVQVRGTGFSSDGDSGTASAHGGLDSAARCTGNRTVRVYAFVGETKKLLDVDVSSRNGAWSGQGRVPSNPDGYQVVAERDRRGKIVCGKGSVAT